MRKHWKTLAIVALAVLGVGLAGSLAGSGGAGPAHTDTSGPAGTLVAPQPDAVMASIDKALGRGSTESASQAQPAAKNSGSVAAVAPAPAIAADGSGGAAKPSAPTTGGASGAPAAAASSIDDRKIVQTATLSMQVKDVGGISDQVGLIAGSAGGFVAASKFSSAGDQQFATITIKVPADKYQDVLSQVRKLGAKVDSDASNASDVTEEYTDLSAQLRNQKATEAQLLTFLGQAKSISDVLQVQDRLNSVRGDIERTQGRINLLDKLSDMGTISVSLRPVAVLVKTSESNSGFSAEVSRAWQHSLDVIGGIATGVATVLVFSWWLLLLGIPALMIWQRWLRNHASPQPAAYD